MREAHGTRPEGPLSTPTIREVIDDPRVGERYRLRGWVRTRRDTKRVRFLAIDDGSCATALQVVVPGELPGYDEEIERATNGASVVVDGELATSKGQDQDVELKADALEVIGEADPESYPLQKKRHGLEFLRSVAHLRARTRTFGAVFRIRSTLAQETHRFFADRSFVYVHTPIITASDCEGAGEMFPVANPHDDEEPFFGRPAFLTVSGQLNAEALAYGLGWVYTFGPTFRAENSNTSRHLSEFWMIEPEMAFYDVHADMDLAEAYLKHLLETLLERHGDDVELLERFNETDVARALETTRDRPFERIRYGDAIEILRTSGKDFEYPVDWGHDLQTEHERFLAEEYFGRPVMIRDWPRDIKAFYMYQNDDEATVGALDVIVPGIGELIGGSQREHRIDRLERRLRELGMNPEDYAWYLELNRYGAVPHAGFGMGFERAVMFCTGMQNIRDVVPFPRAPGQAAF